MNSSDPVSASDPSDLGETSSGLRTSDALTLTATFFAVGVTVSVALVERGTATEVVLIGSLFIFAVTSQLAYIAVEDAGGSALAAIVSGWLVASRFGIHAVTLSGLLRASLLERIAAAYCAIDPNVGLMMQHTDPKLARKVYWQITSLLVAGFVAGNVVGVVLGNVLGDTQRWGFDVVFPAALLAIIGNLLRRRDAQAAAILGIASFLAFLPWAPAGLPILASALGAVLVAVAGHRLIGVSS